MSQSSILPNSNVDSSSQSLDNACAELDRRDVSFKVVRIIQDHLDADPSYVFREDRPLQEIMRDLMADSLDQVEVIMAIEEEFEIEVMDDDAENLFNAGLFADLITYIQKADKYYDVV